MPKEDQYAEWAITLPNQFQPLGEVMSQGLAMQQRRNEQMMRLKQEQLKQQRDDTDANLKYLNDKTGDNSAIEKEKTGIEAINMRTHDELNNVFQKYKDLARNLSPSEFQGQLTQDLVELSKWHTGATTAYNNMVGGIGDITKETPNLDTKFVRDTGMQNIASKFINPDGSLVKSELIHNVDPLSDFKDKEMLAHATNDTTPFYDFFQKFPKTAVGDKDYTGKKGFINKYNWKGSMLGELTQVERDDDNKPQSIALKYDTVPGFNDENGKPMRLMKEDLYNQLQGTKGTGNSMDRIWLDNKDKVIHDWSVRNWARLKRLPNAEEQENLKRNFLYKEAQNQISSTLQTDESNITPRPQVSINFGFQQRQQAEEVIDNLTNAVKNKDSEKLKQYASYFNRGNTNSKLTEAFFLPDGKAVLQYQVVDSKGKKQLKEKYLRSDDPYLRDEVIGTYQDFLGSSVPTETIPIGDKLPNVKPVMGEQHPHSTNKKKIDGF